MNSPTVRDIAQMLAGRVDQLVVDLLPAGHREGHEWRAGSVAGEPGNSLGVRLTAPKRGIWCDFSAGQKGDALDLVCAVLEISKGDAIQWARQWLELEDGAATMPARPTTSGSARCETSDYWRKPWRTAKPIAGTIAATYLAARGLRFHDPKGNTLRFAGSHPRRNCEGRLERHPALLALASDIRTGEPVGTINVYLQPDGCDRLRDKRGKTSWGRTAGSAVLLSAFDEPTLGLTVCEGTETGISLYMAEQRPVWALGGAGNVGAFPVLNGIECLTVAADADEPGQKAADAVARRWRDAGREVVIIAPPTGDWADSRKESAA